MDILYIRKNKNIYLINQSKGNKLCNEQHLSSLLKTETVKSYKTKARYMAMI